MHGRRLERLPHLQRCNPHEMNVTLYTALYPLISLSLGYWHFREIRHIFWVWETRQLVYHSLILKLCGNLLYVSCKLQKILMLVISLICFIPCYINFDLAFAFVTGMTLFLLIYQNGFNVSSVLVCFIHRVVCKLWLESFASYCVGG